MLHHQRFSGFWEYSALEFMLRPISFAGYVNCPHQEPTPQLAKGLAEAECHVPGVLRREIRHTFCVRLGFQMLDGSPEGL